MNNNLSTPYPWLDDIMEVHVLKLEQKFVDFERKFFLADYRQDILELRLLQKYECSKMNNLILLDAKDGSLTKTEMLDLIAYNNSLPYGTTDNKN